MQLLHCCLPSDALTHVLIAPMKNAWMAIAIHKGVCLMRHRSAVRTNGDPIGTPMSVSSPASAYNEKVASGRGLFPVQDLSRI
jgi:hypothetical protein